MKLISSVSSLAQYNQIKDKINGIVIGNDNYAIRLAHSFYNDELFSLAKKALADGKEVIIFLNIMATNDDLEMIKGYIKYLMILNVKYLVQDLGVLQLFKEMNLIDRVIYDPSTMVTNYEDLKFYLALGINACSISLEIPVKDALLMQKKVVGGTFYKVFGYHTMFHSKRKLISTYKDFIAGDFNINNSNSYLKEEKREYLYHITEDNKGTNLFRPYVISMLKEIKHLTKMEYLYLDNIFIDDETFNVVAQIFHEAIFEEADINELLKRFALLNLKTEDGFMYQDTVYLKEELKNEKN